MVTEHWYSIARFCLTKLNRSVAFTRPAYEMAQVSLVRFGVLPFLSILLLLFILFRFFVLLFSSSAVSFFFHRIFISTTVSSEMWVHTLSITIRRCMAFVWERETVCGERKKENRTFKTNRMQIQLVNRCIDGIASTVVARLHISFTIFNNSPYIN